MANSDETVLPIIYDKRQLKACVQNIKWCPNISKRETQNYVYTDLGRKDLGGCLKNWMHCNRNLDLEQVKKSPEEAKKSHIDI